MSGGRHALLIGTSHSLTGLEGMPAIDADLSEIRHVLEDLCGFQSSTCSNSGLLEIKGILRKISREQRPDLLLIYFSGHGMRDGDGKLVLSLPYMASNAPELSGIAFSELDREARASSSREILFILDCCHAGLIVPTQPQTEEQAVCTLAACRGEESAFVQDGRSLFTRNICEIIRRAPPGTLRPDELYRQLHQRLPAQTMDSQRPAFFKTPSHHALSSLRNLNVFGETPEYRSKQGPRTLLPRSPLGDAGVPLISETPSVAFDIKADDIFKSIAEQFEEPGMAIRELGQNSMDAGASRIYVRHEVIPDCIITHVVDDGSGMDLERLRLFYLTIFRSGSEDDPKKVGYFSTGKLSIFRFKPIRIQTITRSDGCPPYQVDIASDLHGKISELTEDEWDSSFRQRWRVIGASVPNTGTVVSFTIKSGSEQDRASHIELVYDSARKYLRYIRPQVHCESAVSPGFGTADTALATVNEQIFEGDPKHHVFRATVGTNKTHDVFFHVLPTNSPEALSKYATATLTSGLIPIEGLEQIESRGCKLPSFHGLRIIVESTGFKCNIGRSAVVRDELYESIADILVNRVLLGAFAKQLRSVADPLTISLAIQDLIILSDFVGSPLDGFHDVPIARDIGLQRLVCLRDLLDDQKAVYIFTGSSATLSPIALQHHYSPTSITLFAEDLSAAFKKWLTQKRRRAPIEISSGTLHLNRESFVAQTELLTEKLMSRRRPTLALFPNARGQWWMEVHLNLLAAELQKIRPVLASFTGTAGEPETVLEAEYNEKTDEYILNLNSLLVKKLLGGIQVSHGIREALLTNQLFRILVSAKGSQYSLQFREELCNWDLFLRLGPQAAPKGILGRLKSLFKPRSGAEHEDH